MGWRIVCCKYSKTLIVSQRLADEGFEVFCPVIVEKKRVRRKRWPINVTKPAFPGYFFINDSEYIKSNIRINFLKYDNKPIYISNDVISEMMNTIFESKKEEFVFLIGDNVEIVSGLFKDRTGKISAIEKSYAVVDFQDFSRSMKISTLLLKKIV